MLKSDIVCKRNKWIQKIWHSNIRVDLICSADLHNLTIELASQERRKWEKTTFLMFYINEEKLYKVETSHLLKFKQETFKKKRS